MYHRQHMEQWKNAHQTEETNLTCPSVIFAVGFETSNALKPF